jgi:putative ABC transport system permease protein
MAVYLKDSEDEDLMAELDEYLMENRDVGGWLDVYTEGMEAEANGAFKSIMLLVPEDPERMDDYIKLKSRTKDEQYALDGDNAFISEKLAMKLSLKVGDTMTIKIDETKEYTVTVGAIVENYMQYYVYMSPEAYEKVFDDEPKWNQRLLRYGEGVELSVEDEERLSADFLGLDGVTAMVSSSELRSTIKTMLKALDYVVLVLIGAAGLLAFVVLYNLNNINITERKRELATIKLLGFYPGELAAYVYRENIILTALGIGMGVLLGTWLTNYVIETVEIDMIMFGRGIDTGSYIIGTLMTITFSVIVNVVMYYRLQKIDMIESLKSVE